MGKRKRYYFSKFSVNLWLFYVERRKHQGFLPFSGSFHHSTSLTSYPFNKSPSLHGICLWISNQAFNFVVPKPYVHVKTCSHIFLADLFFIDPNWKQPKCPLPISWQMGKHILVYPYVESKGMDYWYMQYHGSIPTTVC